MKTIIPGGFLPVPLAVTNNGGLTVAQDDSNCKFLTLFQRMTIQLDPPGWNDGLKTDPYDICCPTVRASVTSRMRNICIYFPSQVMVVIRYKKHVHPRLKINDPPRTRPLRVAVTRQRELMAIIVSGITKNSAVIDL